MLDYGDGMCVFFHSLAILGVLRAKHHEEISYTPNDTGEKKESSTPWPITQCM